MRIARIAAVALIASSAIALGGCWTTQKGEKVGMITKISRVGNVCPTWEAEIVRGGFNAGTGVSGAAFDFTIESDQQAAELQQAMEAGSEVKITWHREMTTFCRSESNDFLDTFTVLQRGTSNPYQPAPAATSSIANAPPLAAADRLKVIAAIVAQNQELLDLLKADKAVEAKAAK